MKKNDYNSERYRESAFIGTVFGLFIGSYFAVILFILLFRYGLLK